MGPAVWELRMNGPLVLFFLFGLLLHYNPELMRMTTHPFKGEQGLCLNHFTHTQSFLGLTAVGLGHPLPQPIIPSLLSLPWHPTTSITTSAVSDQKKETTQAHVARSPSVATATTWLVLVCRAQFCLKLVFLKLQLLPTLWQPYHSRWGATSVSAFKENKVYRIW